MERDGKKMNEIIISIISTHTLTWSVTCDEICIQHQNLYFNSHAHVERDVIIVSLPLKYLNFNSHAHVERDFIKKLSDEITKISTHTLTWSVTIVHKLKITVENNFNSHAHVERDRDVDMFQKCICYFNSHAHVERDSSPIVNAYGVVYFNSHAHVERDALLKFSLCQIIGISTHTLTWSVTSQARTEAQKQLFQLTRSRGA